MKPRVVVIGGTGCGQRELAEGIADLLGVTVLHVDELAEEHEGSDVSAAVAQWMVRLPGPYVFEGVAAVRCVRQALRLTTRAPLDVLVVLRGANVGDLEPELQARGVDIVDGEAALAEIRRNAEAAQ